MTSGGIFRAEYLAIIEAVAASFLALAVLMDDVALSSSASSESASCERASSSEALSPSGSITGRAGLGTFAAASATGFVGVGVGTIDEKISGLVASRSSASHNNSAPADPYLAHTQTHTMSRVGHPDHIGGRT